jgi:hypothetical protein
MNPSCCQRAEKNNLFMIARPITDAFVLGGVLLDLLFTIAIGVAVGLYPSAEASRMDVINAMRLD